MAMKLRQRCSLTAEGMCPARQVQRHFCWELFCLFPGQSLPPHHQASAGSPSRLTLAEPDSAAVIQQQVSVCLFAASLHTPGQGEVQCLQNDAALPVCLPVMLRSLCRGSFFWNSCRLGTKWRYIWSLQDDHTAPSSIDFWMICSSLFSWWLACLV